MALEDFLCDRQPKTCTTYVFSYPEEPFRHFLQVLRLNTDAAVCDIQHKVACFVITEGDFDKPVRVVEFYGVFYDIKDNAFDFLRITFHEADDIRNDNFKSQ